MSITIIKSPVYGMPGLNPHSDAYQSLVMSEASLVAYWPMGDTSGGMYDIKNGVTGTLSGNYVQRLPPVVTGSPRNLSTWFTGGNASGSHSSLPTGNTLTMECWVKPNSRSGTNEYFVFGNAASNGTNRKLEDNTSGGVSYSVRGSAQQSGTHITNGTVNHIVASVSANAVTLYWNGSVVASGNLTHNTANTNFGIGPTSWASASFTAIDAYVVHCAVYSTALSAATVASHLAVGLRG